jgi:hypothetical protein
MSILKRALLCSLRVAFFASLKVALLTTHSRCNNARHLSFWRHPDDNRSLYRGLRQGRRLAANDSRARKQGSIRSRAFTFASAGLRPLRWDERPGLTGIPHIACGRSSPEIWGSPRISIGHDSRKARRTGAHE